MMNQLPAAGLVKLQVSLFPLTNGLQSKVAVVGCDPNRTYRSASPVPPLICTLSELCPAGTAMKKNRCELVAPERFDTATPFCSCVSPFAAVTVTCAVALWLTVPEVPVTVKVVAPDGGAVDAAVRVKVELPPAVTVAGLKAPVTPVGRPDTDNEMVCVLPFSAEVDTVYAAVPPAATVLLAGETAMPKSGGGGGPWTVRVTVVECVAPGEVPVTVSVYVPPAAVPAFTVSVELPPAVTE